jgi:hypothetical protein
VRIDIFSGLRVQSLLVNKFKIFSVNDFLFGKPDLGEPEMATTFLENGIKNILSGKSVDKLRRWYFAKLHISP